MRNDRGIFVNDLQEKISWPKMKSKGLSKVLWLVLHLRFSSEDFTETGDETHVLTTEPRVEEWRPRGERSKLKYGKRLKRLKERPKGRLRVPRKSVLPCSSTTVLLSCLFFFARQHNKPRAENLPQRRWLKRNQGNWGAVTLQTETGRPEHRKLRTRDERDSWVILTQGRRRRLWDMNSKKKVLKPRGCTFTATTE